MKFCSQQLFSTLNIILRFLKINFDSEIRDLQFPNIIFDIVGGAYSEAALRSIAWEGRFLIIGFPSGIAKLPLNLPLLKGCECTGVFWGTFCEKNQEKAKRNHEHLIRLLKDGKLKPKISEVHGLENAERAIEQLKRRKVIGKVVVIVSDS